MKIRNRFVMFILFYLFGPFYIFYWIGSVQNGIYYENKFENTIGSFLTVILIIFTFGLYYFVWQWETCSFLKERGAADLSILTFILSLLLVGLLLNPFLIQGQINKIAKDNIPPHLQHYV